MVAWDGVDIIWRRIVYNGQEEFDIVERPLKMNEFLHKKDMSKLESIFSMIAIWKYCPFSKSVTNYNFRKKEMKKLERLQQKERNGNQMANDFMEFVYDDELGADEIQGL